MQSSLRHYLADAATKVPQVTLIFWIIKIAATTLGETGGDTVTMTLHWGYLTGIVGTLIWGYGDILVRIRPY